MRLRLREFRPEGVRVVQPWKPLRHTALSDPGVYGWLVGDRDGLATMSGLFSFAAYSRHTIVHVPLRNGVPLEGEEEFLVSCGGRLDLVLVHHSMRFRVSRWPRVRRGLVNGAPLTALTNEQRTARDAAVWEERFRQAEMRDWLRPATHAHTLFLTGSRDAFASAAKQVFLASVRGPAHADARGRSALMTTITHVMVPEQVTRHAELDVAFKPYPPYAHFRL